MSGPTDELAHALTVPPEAAPEAAPDASPDAGDGSPDLDSDVGARLRQARVRQKLFGKPLEPVQVGRFKLLEQIGTGGMGEVFSAYDERLDRKVALKLVRSDLQAAPEARERLLNEARVLARISHPNVVPVYEVGMFIDRVFIAMEFVRGQTLDQRVAELDPLEPQHRNRAILDLYLAAGRGLQAAHAKGLVHRDFKPSNVLVGEDGRVRVLDFGLAREAGPALDDLDERDALEPTDPASSPRPPIASDTATGAVMGTPRFMAPEQFRGDTADHRSDQFSFCVALFQALYQEDAFPGTSYDALRERVLSGEVKTPERRSEVPAPIYRALLRGLCLDPDERFPDMGALMDALESVARRQRRRRIVASMLAIAVLAAGAAVAITSSFEGASDRPTCTGAPERMAEVWGPKERAAIERAFVSAGTTYADEARALIERDLDQYRDQWVNMHRDACLAHRSGQHSALLLDRRMACLEDRKRALASAVTVLESVASNRPSKAVEVADALPPIAFCGDVEALLAEVPPPEEPEVRIRVAAIQERLALAAASRLGGLIDQAAAETERAVTEARELAYPPILAEARLARARALLERSAKNADVAEVLHQAVELSIEHRMDALAVEALARLVYVEGVMRDQEGSVLRYLDVAMPLSRRLSRESGERWFLEGLLHNNAGVVYRRARELTEARAAFERAIQSSQVHADGLGSPPELLWARINLGEITADPARRDQILASAADEFERRLGSHHPHTLQARGVRALFTVDPERAARLLDATCQAFDQYHPGSVVAVRFCLYRLAYIQAELGREDLAAQRMDALLEAREVVPSLWPRLAMAWARAYRGEHRSARDGFLEVVNMATWRGDSSRWWGAENVARANLGLAESELALGEPSAAREALERAVQALDVLCHHSLQATYHRARARAQVTLAGLLLDDAPPASEQRERARELLVDAEAFYTSAGAPDSFADERAEIARVRQVLDALEPR